MKSPSVTCHGTKYKKDSFILLQISRNTISIFEMINEIFIINDLIVLKYIIVDTEYYDKALNAYSVLTPHNLPSRVMTVKDLIFFHPLPVFKQKDNLIKNIHITNLLLITKILMNINKILVACILNFYAEIN